MDKIITRKQASILILAHDSVRCANESEFIGNMKWKDIPLLIKWNAKERLAVECLGSAGHHESPCEGYVYLVADTTQLYAEVKWEGNQYRCPACVAAQATQDYSLDERPSRRNRWDGER